MHSEADHQTEARPARGGLWRRFVAAWLGSDREGLNRYTDARKRQLLGGLRGRVVELGPGGGTNLRYYGPGVQWVGIEPMLAIHPYLREEAKRLGMPVELRADAAEQIELPAASVDAVVSTHMMCSVDDQARVLAEIRRVLKPGGPYVFLEHVAAPHGSSRRFVQNLLTPVSRLMGDGCHMNRETWKSIESAGFTHLELDHFLLPYGPFAPHIAGRATN